MVEDRVPSYLFIISIYISTLLFDPVSPAEPIIIGTPCSLDANNINSRSCFCQTLRLGDLSAPSGPGPISSLPESET